MINELHVSLITQLKGVQIEGERGGERGERERDGALSCSSGLSLFVKTSGGWFTCAGCKKKKPAIKVTKSNSCGASSFQGIITFNHKFHFVVVENALAVIMRVECSQRGQVEPISEPGSHFSCKRLRLLVSPIWTLPCLCGDESKNPVARRFWWNESVLRLALISQILHKSLTIRALWHYDDNYGKQTVLYMSVSKGYSGFFFSVVF